MANETALLELVSVIETAEKNGEWNQANWGQNACGTSACAAGWTCIMSGKQLEYNYEGIAYFTTDGDDIEDWAKEKLELNDREATMLFFNNFENDFDKFVITVKNIIDGKYVDNA